MAARNNLQPVLLELTGDTFAPRNPEKLRLAHLPVFQGVDRTNNTRFVYARLADCNPFQGGRLADMLTHTGRSLVDLHHALFQQYFAEPPRIEDLSHRQVSGDPAQFYRYLFTRAIDHGILFETFTSDQAELDFFYSVVYPVFDAITADFGLKPLVTSFLPHPESIFWSCYDFGLAGQLLLEMRNPAKPFKTAVPKRHSTPTLEGVHAHSFSG